MLNKRKRSLSHTPLYASFLVILVTAGFIGVYWSIDKYLVYKQTIKDIHAKYNDTYQKRLIEETNGVIDFIQYKRVQTEKNIEDQLQQKVHIAYITASHIYSLYQNTKPSEELRSMVVEALRPIRWDTNLGYYFAGNASTGRIVLSADRPSLEGLSMVEVQDREGNFFIQKIIDIVTQKGGGLVTYSWKKPENGNKDFEKVAFVKHFSPFNWFIGAGIYIDDLEKQVQKEVIERVREIKFAQSGSFACMRGDGQTLIDFDQQKTGRSILSVLDDKGDMYGQKIYQKAQSSQRSGFVRSFFAKPHSQRLTQKLSYIKYFEKWDWYFIASMFEDEMIAAISEETEKYRNGIFRDILMFSFIFSMTVFLVLILAYFYSSKISETIRLFTDFFKDAAEKNTLLDLKNLKFEEFIHLGSFANQMVLDRNEKERLIKRDELRLDTLFNLSMMEYHSVNEISTFTLERSLKLTGSEMGYISIISESGIVDVVLIMKGKNNQEYLTKTDQFYLQDKKHSFNRAYKEGVPIIVEEDRNDFLLSEYIKETIAISSHLDVPFFDGDDVVAVIGVCNKEHGQYDEADVRQLTIIQEGMWHLILKGRAERELLRLKNLLRSINDAMPSAIIGVDANCQIIQWNRQAELLTGFPLQKVEGKELIQVFPRIKKIEPLIYDVINDGKPREERKLRWMNDGEKQYENISVFPLKAHQYQGAVIRIDDVTEKIRMENMIVQSEKMLSIGGLAAGMAHEINNPLAGIMQNLQVVQNRLSSSLKKNRVIAEQLGISIEQIEEYIQQRNIDKMFGHIEEASTRAAALVSNMLSFSRKSDTVFSNQDIRQLMDKTLELAENDFDLKKNFDFRKIKIVKDYQTDLPLVSCEMINIQQVFLNIIKNGAYALSEKIAEGAEPIIELSIYKKSGKVIVEIEDNGCGISEEKQKRVFEPFFTTKPVGIGTGLGLSISYFIICEQHGGFLEVMSENNQGTKFIITLPLDSN